MHNICKYLFNHFAMRIVGLQELQKLKRKNFKYSVQRKGQKKKNRMHLFTNHLNMP